MRRFLLVMCLFGFSQLAKPLPQDLHNGFVNFGRAINQETILIRHPSKCKSYFECSAKNSVTRICPDCQHFDAYLKRCTENRASVNCLGELPHCNLLRNGTVSPNLDDCSKYFVCIDKEVAEFRCPHGSHFSEELGICTDRDKDINDQCYWEECAEAGQRVRHRTDSTKCCVCQNFTNAANQQILAVANVEICDSVDDFENMSASFNETPVSGDSDEYKYVNFTDNYFCTKYVQCKTLEVECAANKFFSTKKEGCMGYEYSDCKYDYVKNELRIFILCLSVSLIISFVLRKYYDSLYKYRSKVTYLILTKMFLLKNPTKSIKYDFDTNIPAPAASDALLDQGNLENMNEIAIVATIT